ncbi:ABC transporter permease [Cytobacillus sp. IB215665]|uniref:ABC transporter permease n=1 Tax=Cytobacillus sp. IB215665 TaxID=3097357 RepID=UPI002A17A653|nr:ABC transporter permease [Cytobacillus sp. IB215665]MDX8365244.1 ABC transporter permease [Cytobacillus sp. IB215665]
MNTVNALFQLEVKKLLRTWIILGFGVIAPILFLVMQTGISNKTLELYGLEIAPIDYTFPMFAFLSVVVLAIGNVGIGFSYMRSIYFFRRLRLASVKSTQFIFANFLVQLLCAIFTIILLVVVSTTGYSLSLEGKSFVTFGFLLLLSFVMCYFIGVFIGNLTTDPKTSQTLSMIVYFVIIFLGGVTFPFEALPDFMQKISYMLPTTHAVRILQISWNGGDIWQSYHMEFVFVTTIIAGILSIRFFKYD